MNDEARTCQACGVAQATVHLTEFVDGKPIQKHFCEDCYKKEKGVPILVPSNVLAQMIEAVAPELRKLSKKSCPECGLNYLEFRHTMKFGCPHDYEVFAEAVDDLLQRIHGANEHVGKVPATPSRGGAAEERVQLLEQRLQESIKQEDYETAARIRDMLRQLKEDGSKDTQR